MTARRCDLNNPKVRVSILHKFYAKFLSDCFNEDNYEESTKEWLRMMFECPRNVAALEGGGGGVPIIPVPPCPPLDREVLFDWGRAEYGADPAALQEAMTSGAGQAARPPRP